jgi:hypothetical protein
MTPMEFYHFVLEKKRKEKKRSAGRTNLSFFLPVIKVKRGRKEKGVLPKKKLGSCPAQLHTLSLLCVIFFKYFFYLRDDSVTPSTKNKKMKRK